MWPGRCRSRPRWARIGRSPRMWRASVPNPVILADGRVESTGNFHGEPLAYALDLLAIALCGVASISERRTYWILGPGQDRGLPPFLSTEAGLGGGYMMGQDTPAAPVGESKGVGP